MHGNFSFFSFMLSYVGQSYSYCVVSCCFHPVAVATYIWSPRDQSGY